MLRPVASRQQTALALCLTLVWAVVVLSYGRVVCINGEGQRAIEPEMMGQCAPASHCDDSHPPASPHQPTCAPLDCEDESLETIDAIRQEQVAAGDLIGAVYLGATFDWQEFPGWSAVDVKLPARRGPPLRSTSVLIAQTMVLRI